MRGVEEAGWTLGRQRLTRDPCLDARDRVAAVLQDLGDVPDLVGPGNRVQRHLRVVVGVQSALVVLLHRLVEGMPGDIGVQPLQFLAELRDILVSCPLGGGELGLQCRLLRGLALLDRIPPVEGDTAHDQCHHDQQHEEFSHGSQCAFASCGFPLWQRLLTDLLDRDGALRSQAHNRLPCALSAVMSR